MWWRLIILLGLLAMLVNISDGLGRRGAQRRDRSITTVHGASDRSRDHVIARKLPSNVIPFDAIWHFHDQNRDLGSQWREPDFDDSKWKSGPALLGYEAKETTTIAGGGRSHNKPMTVYFRHTFEVCDPAAYDRLVLGLMRDDGAAIYLNGKEVLRNNLAVGASFNASALRRITDSEEETPVLATISESLLLPGTNVFAVEVHQHAVDSSDVSFALTLGTGGVDSLAQMLKSKSSQTRNSAADVLGDLGEQSAAAVHDLSDALRRGDQQLKDNVAKALAKIGPKAWQADGKLKLMLHDRRGDVQYWAAIALAQIDPNGNKLEVLLKRALSHTQFKKQQRLAQAFNAEAWLIVCDTGRTDAEYQYARTVARAACLIEGKGKARGLYLNTLGVAQYRVGLFGEAQKSLGESHDSNGGVPADLAFLAMTSYRFDERDQASQYLATLKAIMKTKKWSANVDAVGFLHEAESMIAAEEPVEVEAADDIEVMQP